MAITPASNIKSQRLPGEIVVPVNQVRVISSPQTGLLDQVMVATGQTVQKGQVLAHISSPDLVTLQRDHLQALSQQRLAKNSLDRDARLYKDGIIAERRYLATQSSHDEISAQLAERRQALRLSGMGSAAIAKLESSGVYTSSISLVSPIDGTVLEQMAVAGQRIDFSMPVYRVAKLNPLWLEIRAPIEALSGVTNGMQVSIANTAATGKVIAIVRNVNKLDQTALIRVEIVSGTEALSPGQLVEAEISQANTNQSSYSVPKASVIRHGGENFIFVRAPQGFEPRKITLINTQANQAIISGNLNGKEKVLVTGTSAVKASWLGIGGDE
ncbi:MAG TPA: efflux RND transporter periplasmic adaptor subunit, partial [Methylophilaceae bacterium]|nr:efflux RND transporter periplasmic adaptor subunit [Methylophilaceae bacterium]